MRNLWVIWTIAWAWGLTACVSTGTPRAPDLPQILADERVTTLPYRLHNGSLFIVDVTIGGQTYPFLLDTGATKSAVFENNVAVLDVRMQDGVFQNIHGLISQGPQPVGILAGAEFGGRDLGDWSVTVLPKRSAKGLIDPTVETPHIGIIGMDLLSQYRIYADGGSETLSFIPAELGEIRAPAGWDEVHLTSNPFEPSRHNLHYLNLRIGFERVPAILDLGAEINLLNWTDSSFAQLKPLRRRLRERWELQGAIGTFTPRARINAVDMRAGMKHWDRTEFVVMPLDNLDILGAEDRLFAIAGAPLLAGQTFLLDFDTDRLWFYPDRPAIRRPFIGTAVQRVD